MRSYIKPVAEKIIVSETRITPREIIIDRSRYSSSMSMEPVQYSPELKTNFGQTQVASPYKNERISKIQARIDELKAMPRSVYSTEISKRDDASELSDAARSFSTPYTKEVAMFDKVVVEKPFRPSANRTKSNISGADRVSIYSNSSALRSATKNPYVFTKPDRRHVSQLSQDFDEEDLNNRSSNLLDLHGSFNNPDKFK